MTLYWNANLQTGIDGIATVTFFNTDVTKQFLVTIEGIGEGVIITSSKLVANSD